MLIGYPVGDPNSAARVARPSRAALCRAATHLSAAWNRLRCMTDPVDAAAGSFTSSNRPKRARATIAELTMIVRPPGEPSAVQAFTAAELREAQEYAAKMGAQVHGCVSGVGLWSGAGPTVAGARPSAAVLASRSPVGNTPPPAAQFVSRTSNAPAR